jgi:chaperonin GroES
MEPRLIKGIQAEYVPAKWSGQNTSGVRVVGKTVLVLMDKCSPKTTGGVELPEDLIERQSMAAESGVLVACAAGAFLLNEDMTAWSGAKPAPGDRVYVEKYAGKVVRGRDGEMYRIMDYGSIGATYEPESTALSAEQITSKLNEIANSSAEETAMQHIVHDVGGTVESHGRLEGILVKTHERDDPTNYKTLPPGKFVRGEPA